MGKAAIGLTFYAIRIRPYRNTSDYKNLSKLDEGYPSFREAIKQVLSKIPSYTEDGFDIKKCPYGLLSHKEQNGGQVVGTVMCGDNGYSANIHDGDTGKLMHKQKSSDHAIHPYYFLFDIPDNTNVALVCLQTYGQHAIKGLFLTEIIKSLREDIYSKNGLYFVDYEALSVGYHLY